MFVHLRTHTEFSIVDGTNRIDTLCEAAAADAQPALAITDLNNLFGAVKFYKSAREQGIKPILGVEVFLADGAGRILLLVQNHQGYLNVCEILARAWRQSAVRQVQDACVSLDTLAELNQGLIALSGAAYSQIGQSLLQGDTARAKQLCQRLAAIFEKRFYIELQRAERPGDETYIQAAIKLAADLALPVVATHPVQFASAESYEAHEARVCIAEGEILANPKRERKFTAAQYFCSQAEMQERFSDIPSAITNAEIIAKRCNLILELGNPKLPDYPTPLQADGNPMPIADYFREASQQGLAQRLLALYPDEVARKEQEPIYAERLEFEIETILKMGFPGYFLIVADFINWAKNHGCPVGPGRGSGAGSLVAYALNITDLDPLAYKLLFERFLNPERVSMPDFDIDFCQANRDRVIDYVKEKYGKDAVSQIATFGTMAARAAIRDVGRVMDFSYGFCDGISKLIPNKPGQQVTIAQAIEQEPLLKTRVENEEEVRLLLEMAQKLEGMTRNVGMHAGGVLIAPSKLTDFCPLYQQPGSQSAISQYDKDDVEAMGLVKFDFLGLATLTILELARKMIQARHPGQADFNYESLPLDDASVYKLFSDGKTEAVFQFESRGMQAMLRDAKPERLEDLIAMNALFRPGPMDLIPSYIARKHGREEVRYPHPLLGEILQETYGIMVYQEQVMQTAQILGGYSLGGADLLRRAMGKKKAEEMAEHRSIFRAGAAKQNIGEDQADEVFDLMEKFAGYGFNKSHAAAYSLLAYHTAWIKRHYTAEFYAANLTVEMGNTDKLKVLIEDAKKFGIEFEAPDINRGKTEFEPVSDRHIRYGLGAIKGSGEKAVEAIIAARAEGEFSSLFDFCTRVDKSSVNKRTVEALIKAGAFDSVYSNRAALLASVDLALEFAEMQAANENQSGLFDAIDSHAASHQEPTLVDKLPWGVRERLAQEKLALGFYLTGHLFDEDASEVRRFVSRKIEDLMENKEQQIVAGIVGDLRFINGNRGRLALFKLDDKSASLDVAADESVLQGLDLSEDALLVIQGVVQADRFTGGQRLQAKQIWDLARARCHFGKYLELWVQGSLEPKAQDLQRLLKDYQAQRLETEFGQITRGLKVRVRVQRSSTAAAIDLGETHQFYPSDAALASWQALTGRAQIVY